MIISNRVLGLKNHNEISTEILYLKLVLKGRVKPLFIIEYKEGWDDVVRILLPLIKRGKIMVILHDKENDRYFKFEEWMIEDYESLEDYDEFDKVSIKEGSKEP